MGHFLSDEYDRSQANKRGADFSFVQAEADLASPAPTPEEAFRKRWAHEILSRAMAHLRTDTSAEDLALLSGQPRPDLSVTDRKNRLFRLRSRLKDCLRQEVLPSLDGARETGSEIREPFSALS